MSLALGSLRFDDFEQKQPFRQPLLPEQRRAVAS